MVARKLIRTMKIPPILAAIALILTLVEHLPAEEAAQAKMPAAAENAPDVLVSPDQRYALTLVRPAKPGQFPLIVLREVKSGRKLWEFDYEWAEERHAGNLHAGWAPDSKHVAVTIQIARVIDTTVLRIGKEKAEEVEFLPIPAKLDKESYTTRGGDSFSHWETNTTLWLNCTTKSRSFRYQLTKDGKLLADAYEDDPN